MSYIPLNIPDNLQGTKVRIYIRACIDPALEDIREMMCISIRRGENLEGPQRQLQYPIATLLVNVISGCADSLMVNLDKLDNKKSFIRFLKEYAPPFRGDLRLSGGGPETLYIYFRNPFVHRLGVPYKKLILRPKITMRFPGLSYRELDSQLGDIERSKEHPYGENPVFATDLQQPDSITLLVESLYWVTRMSIETWCLDEDQVRLRENSL